MPGLCILSGVYKTYLAINAFTLIWTHSIEKTRWEEDYLVTARGLILQEARVQGSGAGMEIPEGSVFIKPSNPKEPAFWRYQPSFAPLMRLNLAASHYTEDYQLCFLSQCYRLRKLVSGRAPSINPILQHLVYHQRLPMFGQKHWLRPEDPIQLTPCT